MEKFNREETLDRTIRQIAWRKVILPILIILALMLGMIAGLFVINFNYWKFNSGIREIKSAFYHQVRRGDYIDVHVQEPWFPKTQVHVIAVDDEMM